MKRSNKTTGAGLIAGLSIIIDGFERALPGGLTIDDAVPLGTAILQGFVVMYLGWAARDRDVTSEGRETKLA